jgi:hypothetical protein
MAAREQMSAVPVAVLDALHQRLAGVYAELAESGPTEPMETMRWTLDELTTVMRYIRAVRKGESADLPE